MKLREKIVKYLLASAASSSILIVVMIFLFLAKESLTFIEEPGILALFNSKWNPVSFFNESFGIYPLITGTLVVTFFATIIAVPFGVILAVYMAEVANPKESALLKPFVELLAGLPSVVLGFFGLVVVAPFIKELFNLGSGLNALTGAVLLAMMAVPTITSISEDALRSVPASYKQASLALGASKLQTVWKVIVPAAMSGIIASIMLGMGRVIGETMAVLMVTGNAPLLTLNPLESVRTMTATIAGEMGEVSHGDSHYSALFWVGLVLLLFTFILVYISHRVLKKYELKQQ